MWGLEQLWQRNQKAAGNPNPGQFAPEPPIVLDEEATARNTASVPWDESPKAASPRVDEVVVLMEADFEKDWPYIRHGLRLTDSEFGKIDRISLSKVIVNGRYVGLVGFKVKLFKIEEYVRLVTFWQSIAAVVDAPGIEVEWHDGRIERYRAEPGGEW